MKRIVSTDDAPAAVGAYSQATETDDLIFTAGQIPLTPDGDLLDGADIDVQTDQALENGPPARSAVEVAALPKEVDIEIEAVATK